MASIYDSIKSAEELVRLVAMQGLSTKQEDIVRAQDIFGHESVDELVRLAHDNGRLDGPNGKPDYKGSWSDGRKGLSATFYSVLFQIWNWEDATRFYNLHSNPEHDAFLELEAKLKEEMAEHTATKKELEHQVEQVQAEHKRYREECGAKLEAQEEVKHLKTEVYDRDMTILELKAKLYDLMMKEAK